MATVVAGQGLKVTAAALAHVQQLGRSQGNATPRLRVSVEGGGCSGFRYGFSLAAAPDAGDFVLDRDGVEVLVDPVSLPYLEGAEIDFVEQLSGAGFVIRNPNAKATCGCGSSFNA